jgi:hypothetical protein
MAMNISEGFQVIPVALFGIDAEQCEEFYRQLPTLLIEGGVFDENYEAMLYRVEGNLCLDHLHKIDEWAGFPPSAWPEEIAWEILAALTTISYPDVSLVESLLTLDGLDASRLSHWLHILTNVYPIYDKDACAGLRKLGLVCPYEVTDMASYGLYVSLIEGIKEYAPATALPEYSLPRQRLIQLGLAAWAKRN